MTTQNATVSNEDQALIDDLFAEMGLEGEVMLDSEINDVIAAEPTVEEAEIEAEPTVEETAVEAAAEPTTEAAEPVVEDVLGDLGIDLGLEGIDLDGLDVGEVTAETEAPKAEPKAKKSLAPKFDEDEKAETKVKPRASSGGNRVTYYNSSKSTVLLDRLGGNKDLIILEAGDLELPKEELQAKRQHLLDVLNNQPTAVNKETGETVQKKVAEKVIQLFTYLNRGGNLNRYTYIALKVLLTDGYLNTKKNGNLYQAYIANGYKEGTASAQSGQMSQLLPLLKIAHVGQGQLIPNDQSIILAKMQAEIFGDQQAA